MKRSVASGSFTSNTFSHVPSPGAWTRYGSWVSRARRPRRTKLTDRASHPTADAVGPRLARSAAFRLRGRRIGFPHGRPDKCDWVSPSGGHNDRRPDHSPSEGGGGAEDRDYYAPQAEPSQRVLARVASPKR